MNTSVLFFDRNHYLFLVFILAYLLCFVLSFLYLPVSSVGCGFFKSLGMARGARLLITVGRGGVRSVRSKNKSYVGQS